VEQPVHVHFTDEFKEGLAQRDGEDDSGTETVEEKLKTGTDEGPSVSDDKGTCRSLWQPTESVLFTSSSNQLLSLQIHLPFIGL